MGKEDGLERELRLNQLYLAIISRYKEYIEEKERISVAELPTLVTPKNESISKKTDEIKRGFGTYSYGKDFYEAALHAFSYVNDEIEDVTMPLQFWLVPEETMSFRIGDVIDRNTLLCSLLVALGNPSAKVLVCIKSASRRIFTYFEFDGKIAVMDFGSGVSNFANQDAMVASLGLDENTAAYEFNDRMYIDIG